MKNDHKKKAILMSTNQNIKQMDFIQDVSVLQDERISSIKKLEKHSPYIAKLTHLAQTLTITCKEDYQKAIDIVANSRDEFDKTEELRKSETEPSRKFVKMVNDAAKAFTDELKECERILTVKLAQWMAEQEKEAEQAQKEVKKLSKKLGLDVEILAPSAPTTLSSSDGSLRIREKASFEIADKSLIPDEYWIVDEELIKKHIALGKRDIPGVKIVTEKTLVLRRK